MPTRLLTFPFRVIASVVKKTNPLAAIMMENATQLRLELTQEIENDIFGTDEPFEGSAREKYLKDIYD